MDLFACIGHEHHDCILRFPLLLTHIYEILKMQGQLYALALRLLV
jgi:hypothetical protein